jgi:hypothetical protein
MLSKLRRFFGRIPKLKYSHPPGLPWHHDFLDRKVVAVEHGGYKYRLYHQPYKGIWIIFWRAPTPEDIRMAREDFDNKYPDCEGCGKSLFICKCMVEIDGFIV